MARDRNELKAGIFIVVSIVLVIGVIVAIKGVGRFIEPRQVRTAVFTLKDDIGGLRVGDDVRVGGLKPDQRYWFRFSTKTTHSEVGRTQTAPAPDSQRPIKVGYFACQDFASGYYGVYQELLRLDPDVVICGGDYIYDRIYSDSGYGGVREDKAGSGPDASITVCG